MSITQISDLQNHIDIIDVRYIKELLPCVTVAPAGGIGNYICDGTADDVQIQAAIDEVYAAGGGDVYIKAHTDYYDITQAITLPAGVDIWLHGENKFATRLKLAANSNCNVIEVGTAASSSNFAKITDLYLDGNRDNQTDLGGDGLQCGIFTHSQNYVTLRDLSINRCVAQGIYSHDWSSHLENIFIGTCGWQGIEIDASQYTTLINCTARACGSTTVLAQGIDIVGGSIPDQPSQIMVIGCHTYRNFGPGFAARNAQNVSFMGCESLEDGTNNGVEFATTRPGFHIKDSERVSVIGCHSRLSTLAGIHIEDSDRCIIQGNHCVNNGGTGEAATSAGILITNGQRNIVEGNQCYDDQTPKIQAYGVREVGTTDYSKIENNDVSGNLTGTIVRAGANSQITNNMGHATENFNFNAPEGFLINGKVVPSVTSNNLTVSIKGMDGNDPSITNAVYVRINGTIRSITAALSVTKNAATNWCNAGSTELATKEIDYFVYLGYNATDGVVIGFSRISHATLYSDFSTTTTNEKYAGISTISNAVAGDNYVNIGRFAATLSAGAGYTWSVPTFTASNLIQRPIYETRWLDFTQTVSGSTGTIGTFAVSGAVSRYMISGQTLKVQGVLACANVGSWTGNLQYQMPFAPSSTAQTLVQNINLGQVLTYGTATVEGWCYDISSVGIMRFVSAFSVTLYPFSSFAVNDLISINSTYEI